MIKVERPSKPAILEEKAEGWTHQLLTASTKKHKDMVMVKYRHRSIKKALVEMFHGKCAYCESKITHVDYGHIEHFKPKSNPAYAALCFEWKNLLLACGICNGTEYKGDNFPGESEGGPLVNPCEDEPNDHFDFLYDQTAKIATVISKTKRGEVTEKLLALNRPELRSYRSKQVQRLYVLSVFAKTNPEAKALFQESQLDSTEYSAFSRTLAR